MAATAGNTPMSRPRHPFDPPGSVTTTDVLTTHIEDRMPMLNQYIRWAKVGGGQHGEVFLGFDTSKPNDDPERAVAIKSVKRDNPRAEKLKQLRKSRLPKTTHTAVRDRLNTTETKIRKEIAIMKKCRNAHVVRLQEVIDDRMRDKIYMIMEYLGGGEVKWRTKQEDPVLTVDQCRRIMRDVILGLEYLHYQGIIHRDIKPANLLWTSDRSKIKIADFGVSHFSYAQRLAAAGAEGAKEEEDSYDPILLEDSDLSKRAGTPSFLAPEVVFEYTEEPSQPSHSSSDPSDAHGSSATLQSLTTSNRPPITKAIDVWAFGVTLYCLLFGRVPFESETDIASQREHSLYHVICNKDWNPAPTMGFDEMPTGGRHPTQEGSEPWVINHLLDHLLEKDVRKRMTLPEVKSYSWFIRDIPRPDEWLQKTSPSGQRLVVSEAETASAMSAVRFRWKWGAHITRHLSSLFRTIRPQGSRDRITERAERELNSHGVSSAPSSNTSRSEQSMFGSRRDKGKRRSDVRPAMAVTRSKSVERWRPRSKTKPMGIEGSSLKARRGSETLVVPPQGHIYGSTQSSPLPEERPSRARFSINVSAIWSSRPNKSSPQEQTPVETSPVSLNTHDYQPGPSKLDRRSEEALRHQGLTAARRASSWGDNPMEFNDVTSLDSDEHHDLNDHDMIVGAGGVSNEEPLHHRNTSVAFRPRGDSIGPRSHQERFNAVAGPSGTQYSLHHTPSQLTQLAYHGDAETLEQGPQFYDDDSIFSNADDSDEDEEVPQQSYYDDDDEDSDDEPLEVRRAPRSPRN